MKKVFNIKIKAVGVLTETCNLENELCRYKFAINLQLNIIKTYKMNSRLI
jgi:hypothetical protein